MKFSDGYWLTQPGYQIHYASQAYEIHTTEDSVTILATPTHIWNRGQTLGGPNLEITFTAPLENVIGVSIVHYKGTPDRMPKFELHKSPVKPVIQDGEATLTFASGKTKVVIGKNDWSIQYFHGDRPLTSSSGRALSYIEETKSHAEKRLSIASENGFWAPPADTRTTYLREQLSLGVGESIYGFGEKFTQFVKNGQSIDMWNADGGTSSDQSYKCIPFYLSSNRYGIFVNSSDHVSFEVGSDTVSNVSFTIPGERLEYFVFGGDSLGQVLESYTTLTGKPALPPAWSFGLWLTTSFTTTYDEETINSFIGGMARREIPLQVFHFDCFWMREFRWCDFAWDTRQFPDPAGMLDRLHKDSGLKVCVWVNPYIGQQSALFDEGAEKGYFLHTKDGGIFQCDLWQPGMALVDFTNPDACQWYADKLRALCEMGVDCFKTDFGERIPTDVVYHNGAHPVGMHNYYTQLYNQTVFKVLKEFYGESKACLFARSATVGGQRFPVHWGGDCAATYPSMAETLRGGLSLTASGFGFFSHDISGFEATATPDIYKRWCAFGLLSSHSRLHGNSSYRVPWLFDEEACDVLRHFTKLKGRLMPYLYAEAVRTHETGVPMMRPMVIDFTEDRNCHPLDRQYMLGENLLCAPVMNDQNLAEFYIPQTDADWVDVLTGKSYAPGKWYRETVDYFHMPILARPGSIIVYGAFRRDFQYDYLTEAEAVVYNLSDGATASARIYDTNGILLCELCAVREASTIRVTYTKTNVPFHITVHGGSTVTAEPGTTEVEIQL